MKKFLVVREIKHEVFETKVNEVLEEGKYDLVNSGATERLGWWAFFLLKD